MERFRCIRRYEISATFPPIGRACDVAVETISMRDPHLNKKARLVYLKQKECTPLQTPWSLQQDRPSQQ
jgi:hypothetical protein